MPKITSIHQTSQVVDPVVVYFADVTFADTDDDLKTMAYDASNERPSSTFGTTVHRYDDGVVTVTIERD